MKDRIHQILDWTTLSQQDFANRLGISPASLSSIFTGRTNPTNNHVQAIHRAFPEINVSWLLFGEGEMMNVENPVSPQKSGNGVNVSQEETVSGLETGQMPSMFSDEDFGNGTVTEPNPYMSNLVRRENYQARPTGFQYMDNAKKNDIKVRKIKEIRVFFDDGTYESFVPSGGK